MSSGSILPFTGIPVRLEELGKVSRELGTWLTPLLRPAAWNLIDCLNSIAGEREHILCSSPRKGPSNALTLLFNNYLSSTCSGPGITVLDTTGLGMTITDRFPVLCSLQRRGQIAGKWKHNWYIPRMKITGTVHSGILITSPSLHRWGWGFHPRGTGSTEHITPNTEHLRPTTLL